MSTKIERVPLRYQGNNPQEIRVEAEVEYNPGEGGRDYQELRISFFKGVDSKQCVADVFIGLNEHGEIRILTTTNGEGEGDHSLAIYPLRPLDHAFERF